jgi:protein TonB
MSYQALLYCPDEKTARVLTQILSELNFGVDACGEPFSAVKKLMAQRFDAVVVDCENEQNATLLFKSARNSGSNQAALSVAVVEGQAGVANAFRIGANLVLTKPINVEQSKGTLRVARGLLRKSAEAPKSAAPGIPAAPAPPSQEAAKPFPVPTPQVAVVPATASAPPTRGGFELEMEPGPKPEPAEAALLESMHDAIPSAPAVAKKTQGEMRVWQAPIKATAPAPSAKPKLDSGQPPVAPVGEALGLQVPAAGSAAGTANMRNSGVPSLSLSASAPAPAKEKPASGGDHHESEEAGHAISDSEPATASDSPLFANYDETGTAGGSGRSKTFLLVIAAAILIAAGYYAWANFRGSKPAPVPPAAVPAQTSNQVNTASPSPAAAADAVNDSAAEPASSSVPAQVVENTAPDTTTRIAVEHSAPLSPRGAAPVRDSEALIVKPGSVQAKPAEPESTPEPPPSPLAAGGAADPKVLKAIANPSAVAVPQPIAQQAVRISQGVSQGLLIKQVQPVYPPQAIEMRVQGSVQMQATISKEGKISDLKVVSGDPVLARAAVNAVRQWKYKPYYLNGDPTEVQTEIIVNFRLPR